MLLRSDRLTWSPSRGMMPRGSGENQAIFDRRRRGSTGIGNSPGAVCGQQRARFEVGADRDEVLAGLDLVVDRASTNRDGRRFDRTTAWSPAHSGRVEPRRRGQ